MLQQIQKTIARAVLAGSHLEAIERDIIERAPLDEEQKSVLWLYAQAVTDRPARLQFLGKDPIWVGRM